MSTVMLKKCTVPKKPYNKWFTIICRVDHRELLDIPVFLVFFISVQTAGSKVVNLQKTNFSLGAIQNVYHTAVRGWR